MPRSATPSAPVAAPAKPKAEFDQLLEDVIARLRDVAENAGDKTEDALHTATVNLTKSAKKLSAHAKATSRAAATATVKGVKEHPVASAAIAATAVASVAAIAAIMLRRSR